MSKDAVADIVLTIVGSDRPGLVEAVAEAVARTGGNWLESRMAHLAGKFAGILRVQAPADAVPRLVTAIEQLAHADLKVTVERGTLARPSPGVGPSVELDLVGLDRPGIVRDISGVLADEHISIESMHTLTFSAPMSGERLFRAHMRLSMAQPADVSRLRADLERFATDLMVELRLIEMVSSTRSGRERDDSGSGRTD